MIRRCGVLFLTVCFSVGIGLSGGNVAEAARPAANAQVTQAELAEMLVQVLGLARYLPSESSHLEQQKILSENGVVPPAGWKGDEVVTRSDLAMIVVQALKKQHEVKDVTSAQECINFLKELGVSIDTVGSAVDGIDPLAEPVGTSVASVNTDPLAKRHKVNPLDEDNFGVPMTDIARIFSEFELIFGELRAVTPN